MNEKTLLPVLFIGILLTSLGFSHIKSISSVDILCGQYSNKTITDFQGMKWDVFILVTCSDNEILQAKVGSSLLLGEYIQAYDVVIEDITPKVMDDGTVLSRSIKSWSNYEIIPGCQACAQQPPIQFPNNGQVTSMCGWIESDSQTGALSPLFTEWETGTQYPFDALDSQNFNRVMELGIPGYFLIYDPVIRQGFMARFSTVEKVESCANTKPNIMIPTFVYPTEGQSLDFDGDFLFKVDPLLGASEYFWQFYQNSEKVWSSEMDPNPSGSEYGIYSNSESHNRFVPGEVEIIVFAVVDLSFTQSGVLHITLVQQSVPSITPTILTSATVTQVLPRVEVEVPHINQHFRPPDITSEGLTDIGILNCVPASVAMVLQSLEARGIISNSVTDYPSIRRAFRLKGPNPESGLSPSWIPELVQEFTNDSLTASNSSLDPDNWQEDIFQQLNSGYPVIATVLDWSRLVGSRQGKFPHAIVINGYDGENVLYIDPQDGEQYAMPTESFGDAWGYDPAGGSGYIATMFK